SLCQTFFCYTKDSQLMPYVAPVYWVRNGNAQLAIERRRIYTRMGIILKFITTMKSILWINLIAIKQKCAGC
ncbi:MAG TPA: hypothetical protein DCX94_06255, partial [Alteromonas macleodii]|nr:hypothetical protein [Alteromonas macleodii]